jgi:hypothetical protein
MPGTTIVCCRAPLGDTIACAAGHCSNSDTTIVHSFSSMDIGGHGVGPDNGQVPSTSSSSAHPSTSGASAEPITSSTSASSAQTSTTASSEKMQQQKQTQEQKQPPPPSQSAASGGMGGSGAGGGDKSDERGGGGANCEIEMHPAQAEAMRQPCFCNDGLMRGVCLAMGCTLDSRRVIVRLNAGGPGKVKKGRNGRAVAKAAVEKRVVVSTKFKGKSKRKSKRCVHGRQRSRCKVLASLFPTTLLPSSELESWFNDQECGGSSIFYALSNLRT